MKLLICIFLSVAMIGCRQSTKIPDNFDYGETENGVYRNAYFGFEISIPGKWAVQSKEEMKKIRETGQKVIEKTNKDLASKIRPGDIGNTMLFAAYKIKTDSVSVEFNPSIIIIAENLEMMTGIKKGTDYLSNVRKLMLESGMGYQVAPVFTSEKIGDKEFDRLKISKNVGETMDIKQYYYVTLEKGFALSFVASFDTDQQKEELMDILNGIKFK